MNEKWKDRTSSIIREHYARLASTRRELLLPWKQRFDSFEVNPPHGNCSFGRMYQHLMGAVLNDEIPDYE